MTRYVELDGKRYLWRDILNLRRQQRQAERQRQQPVLFELKEDARPPSQRKAAGRLVEPTLFEL
jgi:hypothetical protein